jgi:hypothetical protein
MCHVYNKETACVCPKKMSRREEGGGRGEREREKESEKEREKEREY